MKKSKIFKIFALSISLVFFGNLLSVAYASQYVSDIPSMLPAPVVAVDRQNKPVGFCRINLNRALDCFDKEAKEFEIGTVTPDGKLHPKKTKNRFIVNLLPKIDRLAYASGNCETFLLEKNALDQIVLFSREDISGEHRLYLIENGEFVNKFADNVFSKIPDNIWDAMTKASSEDKLVLTAQGDAFTAATEPGYNDPNHGSAGRFFRSGPIYSGTGGQIGRIGSDGTIYSGTGGQIGRIGSDGRVYSGTGGQVGRVPSGDNAVAAYSMVAKAQGMRNPFPGL